jgi:glycine/D-amino acid oxidase-like deaminating enzyme
MQSKDTVIVGAGIIGLSIAYQLARRGQRRILVLEKANGLGEGSTGASSAVCRFKYSHDEMVQLAQDGIGTYQNWADFLELRNPAARYHRAGVLWFDPDASRAQVEASRLRQLGVRALVLEDRELRERFPALNTCVIAPDLVTGESHECREGGQHLLEEDGGYVEPTDALQDLLIAARSRGVEVRFGTPVQDVTTGSSRVTGVTLADGTHVSSGNVVNAAGPWCNDLLATVGLNHAWPLIPTRIQIAQVDLPSSVSAPLPVVGDLISGIYFRPQGHHKHIIVGSILPEDEREAVEDPDQLDRTADDDFVRTKLHALQHRVPGLRDLKGVIGYSGLYTMNISDVHPVVGKTPITGLYTANGCSGHGFKLAPAIGSLVAQAITGERVAYDTQVDLDFLSFDRAPIQLDQQSVLA